MENISPALILLWDIKRALEKGQSVSLGMKFFLNRKIDDIFFNQVDQWWLAQNNTLSAFNKSELAPTRKHLLEILEMGLKGQSILEFLKVYEQELILGCEDEIQVHLARLPLILMFPLMGLIFPALMILLIGPLLKTFEF